MNIVRSYTTVYVLGTYNQVVTAIQSLQYISSLERPGKTYVQSVKNWMDRYKPLVIEETRYLDYEKDLVSLSSKDDWGGFDETIEWLLDKIVPYYISKKVGNYVA